ncbi:MAG: DUF1330 domain-containing protein [Bacteroidales bacterium]|jgi:uncharacterized protein (DUF1330 family)
MYYFITQIKIHDEAEYRKYLDRAEEIFARYKGKYLAVDTDPENIEGTWSYSRVVVIQFNAREDFRAWYYSPEYQEILKHRLNGSECDTILAAGY